MREGVSDLYPINKPVNSYEKAHCRKANSTNINCESISMKETMPKKTGSDW